MSGHSKWSTIKRQKGVADAKRSAMFGKLSRQISIAARDGKDPESNFKLRLAIDRARAVNMPNANIERAILAGSGAQDASGLKEITYEGFGPGNIAVLAQALTDNPNRTAPELRSLFAKHGGTLGATNSVAWMFLPRGIFRVNKNALGNQLEAQELALIDAGADDVFDAGEALLVYTVPERFGVIRDWFAAQQIVPEEAELGFIPHNPVELSATDQAPLYALLEALEDHDDITNVYTNEA